MIRYDAVMVDDVVIHLSEPPAYALQRVSLNVNSDFS